MLDDCLTLRLGLGLIGIGRPWPTPDVPVPPADEVDALLRHAVTTGVRFFDTAPAYGLSEERLGNFLRTLPNSARADLTVATKAGEQWSPDTGSVVDHSPAALARSLKRSVALLGHIDVLQVHKCTADILERSDVVDWFASMRGDQVGALGASVSTSADLAAALRAGVCDFVQFPANAAARDLAELFNSTAPDSVTPIINRPFASGALAGTMNPFAFHHQTFGRGVVLTGTTNRAHFDQNWKAFRAIS